VLADDYALTHKSVFKLSGELPPRTSPKDSSATAQTSNGNSKTSGRTSSDPSFRRSQRFAAGSTCFYCRKKGHVMAECRALEKKNQRVEPDLVITEKAMNHSGKAIETREELLTAADSGLSPFVSQGFVYMEGSEEKVPINVLRDTGAIQS